MGLDSEGTIPLMILKLKWSVWEHNEVTSHCLQHEKLYWAGKKAVEFTYKETASNTLH